jgi:hypothetical protein
VRAQIYTAKSIELTCVNYCFIKKYPRLIVNMKVPFTWQVVLVDGALEIQHSSIEINFGNYAPDNYFPLWKGEMGL